MAYMMQTKCWDRFLQKGIPTKEHEDFQYLSLKELAGTDFLHAKRAVATASASIVFVNGYFSQELSSIAKGLYLMPLTEGFKSYSMLLNNRYNKVVLEDSDPFALLNAAKCPEGAFLYVPPKFIASEPIKIISIVDDKESSWVMPRLQLFVGRSSEISFISRSEGQGGFYNAVMDFELDDDAKVFLDHSDKDLQVTCRFDAIRATGKRSSRFEAVTQNYSTKSRTDFRLFLQGEGAEASLCGLSYLDGNKESHTNVTIQHAEPHTRSMQLFKCVLDDEARSSFQGKIHVLKKAQKTDAYQLNNNLILSPQAAANSKPNLEVFADDVKASHGATCGSLDKEQLFYLKTRGLSEKAAKKLLIQGFCEEILSKVIHHESQ